jgi:hypothetical protein
MFEFKTLDTVIAMIVVILVLSLIVQSVQSLIKKWFKLKSNSILTSLDDLFKYVDSKTLTGIDSSELVKGVAEQLKILGRISLRGAPMIDSIAKDDLVKILGKISVEKRDAAGELILDAAGKTIRETLDEAKLKRLNAEIHTWFDTVMQSFEERYTRYMKSVAVVISIVVVVGLNANFFEVYQNISTSDVLRTAIVERQETVRQLLDEATKDQSQQVTKEEVDKQLGKLKDLLDRTPVFGFAPLKGGDIYNFAKAKGYWETHSNDRFVYILKLLAGWAIMVMLLSVGAPFWQDALESLFGLKNLIRKKTDTRNVEDTGGQPKP